MSKKRDMSEFAKIGVGEKLSYAFGDFGFNFVYGAISTVYTLFLTDYVGLSVYVAGMIILLSRVMDGVSDIICGQVAKKTNSRWGRMRPWLLVCTAPFMLTFVLLFVVPDISVAGRIIYCFVIYNINQTVFSTAINLPYGSLGTLMSRDQNQRTVLQTLRMIIAPLGSMIASAFTIPLVTRLGDNGTAWIEVSILFAVVGAICLFICFGNTRERVDEDKLIEGGQNESQLPFLKSIKLLVTNYYWWMGLVLWGSMNYIFAAASTSVTYYTKYIIGNTDIVMPCQIIERITLIVFIAMCPFLIKKVGKKPLVYIGCIIVIIGQLMMFAAGDSTTFVLLNSFTRGLGVAGIQGCVFVVIADASEYALWRDGIRQDGMVYSAGSIGAKIGPGIGTALVSWIMGAYGYDGTAAVQSAEALAGIRAAFVWTPIVVCVLVMIVMIPYKLDKLYPQIVKDLEERENRTQD